MGQKFIDKRKMREYAADLIKDIEIESVLEFVSEHVYEELDISVDHKTDMVSISCFTDYDEEMENLYQHIEENYS